jgi:hypothetical protein
MKLILILLLITACDQNRKNLRPLWIKSGNYNPNAEGITNFKKLDIDDSLVALMKSDVVKKDTNHYLIRGVDAKRKGITDAGHKINYSKEKKEIYVLTVMSGMSEKDMFNIVIEIKSKVDLSNYKVLYLSLHTCKH